MTRIRQLWVPGFLVLAVLLPVLLGSVGCNTYDSQQKQIADWNGKAQADYQVDETNQDLDTKSKAMEADLATRQRFYQGVSGTYDGSVTQAQGAPENLDTRMIVNATVPEYRSDRIRQLQEIIDDLDNLRLDVQVVQWDPDTGATFGCIFTGIEPDLKTGLIRLIDPSCPNAFSLWLVASTPEKPGKDGSPIATGGADPQAWQAESSTVAQDLLAGNLSQAMTIAVEMDPTHTPNPIRFQMQRSDQ